jgi:hypothetical protein
MKNSKGKYHKLSTQVKQTEMVDSQQQALGMQPRK